MFSADIGHQEVVVFTRPDKQIGLSRDVASPYDRVVGIWRRNGESIQEVMLEDELPMAERSLRLTPRLAGRLTCAVNRMANGEAMNCHKFSRLMHGIHLERTIQDEEPLVEDESGCRQVVNLALGRIGVIGVEAVGVLHSLVGLGEDNPESIQVMSVDGELGICPNEHILDFYQRLFESEARLYSVFDKAA
jgi:hypothetical protein